MSPRAILLDALGTLLALEPPAPLLRAELARRFGVEVSEAQAEKAVAAEIAYYRAHFDQGRDPESLAALRTGCALELRRALPDSERLAAVEAGELTGVLLASLRFTAYPDVKPALIAARAHGRRLVVVSNWDVSLHHVLSDLGLTGLLDGVVTSAEVGARKPAVRIFEHALSVVHVPAGQAVHVGDTFEDDISGARSAGVEPILLKRGPGSPPAGVRTIASLNELASL